MRRIIDHNERHTKIQELRPDRGKQGKQKQKQKQKKGHQRSASTSRRNSRKSGNGMGQDLIDALQQTVDRANGGPVQMFSVSHSPKAIYALFIIIWRYLRTRVLMCTVFVFLQIGSENLMVNLS